MLVASLSVSGCRDASPQPAIVERKVVITASRPARYLAEALLAGSIPVEYLVPDGVDPEHFRPDRDCLADCQSAACVLLSGGGHEPWTAYANLPKTRTIDLAATAVAPNHLIRSGEITHTHGPGGQPHTHHDTAAGFWNDPQVLRRMAHVLAEELGTRFPTKRDSIATHARELDTELAALEDAWQALEAHASAARHVVTHPAHGYITRVVGVDADPIHLELHWQPDYATRTALQNAAARGERRLVWWHGEPDDAVKATLLELGFESVVVRTRVPNDIADEATPPAVHRANIARLRQALGL